jgi:hypothetical protein
MLLKGWQAVNVGAQWRLVPGLELLDTLTDRYRKLHAHSLFSMTASGLGSKV